MEEDRDIAGRIRIFVRDRGYANLEIKIKQYGGTKMNLEKVEERVITLKEITDLISVEHNKAMKKIAELEKEEGFGTLAKMATVYNDKGQTIQTYHLTKKQAVAVGARLNNTLLMKVINRLEELEQNKPQIKLPSKKELAQMVIESETKIERLEHKVEEKDEIILAVADLNIKAGNVTIGDFSKNLAIKGMGRTNMFAWLKANRYLMMNTEPYQTWVTAGYFVRKPSERKINGETKYTTMLTPKGTVWLTKLLKKEYEIGESENV